MKYKSILATTLVGSLLLAGCSNNNSSSSPKLELRVLHASSNAPAVNIQVDDEDTITDLDYGESSDLLNLSPSEYDISVDGISPAGTDGIIADVITASGQALEANMRYDIVAVGLLADIEAIIVPVSTSFDESKVRVTVLHAAANVDQNVDIHVTAPGDALSSDTVTGTLNFKEFTLEPLLVEAGEYRIRLTLEGDLDAVYDSGSLTLNAGDDLFISAITNTKNAATSKGTSPVALSISSDSSSSVLHSAEDGFNLRVIHNSADAPTVDVIANDSVTLVDALSFPDASSYVKAAAGTYSVKVAADADNNQVAINIPSISFSNGDVNTVVAVNKFGDASIEAVTLEDDPRGVATHARVNILHASTVADNLSSSGVDIYILPTGDTDITDNTPQIEDFVFKKETGYVNLEGGVYNIYIALANTTTVATSALNVSLLDENVYLVTARDTDDNFAGATITRYVTSSAVK